MSIARTYRGSGEDVLYIPSFGGGGAVGAAGVGGDASVGCVGPEPIVVDPGRGIHDPPRNIIALANGPGFPGECSTIVTLPI
jgi:hypothetical protein